MILNVVQAEVGFPLPQSSRCQGVQSTSIFSQRSGKGRSLATVSLALAGVIAIAPSALSQDAVVHPMAMHSGATTAVQHSTCANDSQGLMCNTSSHELENPSVIVQASVPTTTVLQSLTHAQMEQLSDLILGIIYFVLPVGFGLALFLHDRYQAYRAATLEAQIKLLEKLWEQSPQA